MADDPEQERMADDLTKPYDIAAEANREFVRVRSARLCREVDAEVLEAVRLARSFALHVKTHKLEDGTFCGVKLVG